MDGRNYSRAGGSLCLLGVAIGILGLVGAALQLDVLNRIVPGRASILPLTSFGVIFTGLSGALQAKRPVGRFRRGVAWVFAALALVDGVWPCGEYIFDFDSGLERMVAIGELPPPHPGRPSPLAALVLIMLALALLSVDLRVRGLSPREWFGGASFLLALLGGVAHAFGAGATYRVGSDHFTNISLPAVLGFLVISSGVLLIRVEDGLLRYATRTHPHAVLLRQLLAFAVLGPLLIALGLHQVIQVVEIRDLSLMLAVFVTSMVPSAVILAVWALRPLRRYEEALEQQDRARQRVLGEQRILAEVGEILTATLESRRIVSDVLKPLVPRFADHAVVIVLDDHEAKLEFVHPGPLGRTLKDIAARTGAIAKSSIGWRSIETRRPVLLAEVPEDYIARVGELPEHFEIYELLRPCSMIAAPMIAHDRCLGSLVFIISHPNSRRYEEEDLRLAVEIARRTALAFDNAQLYEASRVQASIAAALAEGVCITRAADARIVYANAAFERLFGYEPGEMNGLEVHRVNAPGALSPEERARTIIAALSTEGVWHGEILNRRKDESTFWCYASVTAFDHPGHGPVWLAVHTDISARKALEAENARALEEKDLLLREIHHRVKNSLQVISSLFYLQSQFVEDPGLRRYLDESRDRVRSIALVHDLLYRSPSLGAVWMGAYVESLLAAVAATYGGHGREIRVRHHADPVSLDIEHAVPCGMLLSELLSNAFKHAFPAGRAGQIEVRVSERPGRMVCVEVEDDGVGVPSGFDWQRPRSLGLQLVLSLTRQLRGTIELDRARGTRFIVTFPLPDAVGVPAQAVDQLAASARASEAMGNVK